MSQPVTQVVGNSAITFIWWPGEELLMRRVRRKQYSAWSPTQYRSPWQGCLEMVDCRRAGPRGVDATRIILLTRPVSHDHQANKRSLSASTVQYNKRFHVLVIGVRTS